MRIYLVLFTFLASVAWASTATYPFERPGQQAQFQGLLHDLRCPVCQNQDLADSHAPLAADLRKTVYTMVQAGKSDQDIVQHLTARYGDFIVFKPPVKGLTTVLWFGPVCMLAIGLWMFMMLGRKHDK